MVNIIWLNLLTSFSFFSGYDKTGGVDSGAAWCHIKRSKSDTSEKQERYVKLAVNSLKCLFGFLSYLLCLYSINSLLWHCSFGNWKCIGRVMTCWSYAERFIHDLSAWITSHSVVGCGFKSCSGQKLSNNLGQVVHIYVPLSPNSITWCRPIGAVLCSWEGNRRPGRK